MVLSGGGGGNNVNAVVQLRVFVCGMQLMTVAAGRRMSPFNCAQFVPSYLANDLTCEEAGIQQYRVALNLSCSIILPRAESVGGFS